jgi:hypothetical protein
MREIGRQGAGDPGTAGTGYVNRLRCGMRDAVFLLMRPGSVLVVRNSSAWRGVPRV